MDWNDEGFLGWSLRFYGIDLKLNNHSLQNNFFQNPIAYLGKNYFDPKCKGKHETSSDRFGNGTTIRKTHTQGKVVSIDS